MLHSIAITCRVTALPYFDLREAVHRIDKAVRPQVGTNGSAIGASLGETDSRAYREAMEIDPDFESGISRDDRLYLRDRAIDLAA
jgi:hypothetical protein